MDNKQDDYGKERAEAVRKLMFGDPINLFKYKPPAQEGEPCRDPQMSKKE